MNIEKEDCLDGLGKQYLHDLLDNSKIQPIRKTMKIGVNDPCPCGSLKKYKKCCLIKQQQQEADARKSLHESFEEWFKKDEELGKLRMAEQEAIEANVKMELKG